MSRVFRTLELLPADLVRKPAFASVDVFDETCGDCEQQRLAGGILDYQEAL